MADNPENARELVEQRLDDGASMSSDVSTVNALEAIAVAIACLADAVRGDRPFHVSK